MATPADYERLSVWAAMLNPDANIDRRGSKRVVPMQVLSLGLPRTGTLSMREAYSILGYEQPYHFASVVQNCKDADMWNEALRAKFHGVGKPFGRAEFDQLLGESAAITDTPGCISGTREQVGGTEPAGFFNKRPSAQTCLPLKQSRPESNLWLSMFENYVAYV